MDREKVIHGLELVKEDIRERFVSGSQICTDCLRIDNAITLLKEQEETIRNREQEIRDKNERLKERAEQVDSMLKEQKPVEPSRDIALNRRCPKCFAILKGKFCHKCGKAVKWDDSERV